MVCYLILLSVAVLRAVVRWREGGDRGVSRRPCCLHCRHLTFRPFSVLGPFFCGAPDSLFVTESDPIVPPRADCLAIMECAPVGGDRKYPLLLSHPLIISPRGLLFAFFVSPTTLSVSISLPTHSLCSVQMFDLLAPPRCCFLGFKHQCQ